MARSTARTVEAYLSELPDARREVVSAVRSVMCAHLPEGYVETMNWGMISYEIPLARYRDTYNGQPLSYAGLAAQKNNYAVYLTGVYQDPALEATLREAFAAAGKRLDMGRSCIRFRRIEDLPLPAIGEIVAAVPVDALIARYEASRRK